MIPAGRQRKSCKNTKCIHRTEDSGATQDLQRFGSEVRRSFRYYPRRPSVGLTRLDCIHGQRSPTQELRVAKVREVGDKLMKLNYSTRIPNASSSKWTKNGPHYDRLTRMFVGDNLKVVSDFSLNALDFTVQYDGDRAELDHNHQWNKSCGKKKVRYVKVITGSDEKMLSIMVMLAGEASRVVIMVLLKVAHASRANTDAGQATSLEMIANDGCSPLRRALTHLSALLQGKSRRLHILRGFRGCSTVEDWIHDYPHDVDLFANLCLGHCGWIERRMRCIYRQKHLQVLASGHPELPTSQALAVCADFAKTSLHKFRPGVPLEMRKLLKILMLTPHHISCSAVSAATAQHFRSCRRALHPRRTCMPFTTDGRQARGRS